MEFNNTTGKIEIVSPDEMPMLFGQRDEYIDILEQDFGVSFKVKGNELCIMGGTSQVYMARQVAQRLLEIIRGGEAINSSMIRYISDAMKEGNGKDLDNMQEIVAVNFRGKPVKCKTLGQKQYLQALKQNDICLCIGPAGTGKTYLAVAMAVNAYKKKEVSAIILTRPAVEAGEKLGFLPGDLQDKVDPYLRPLYDALYDLLGMENCHKMMDKGTIEIAPLAYMRGRTLHNAYIILDEAQNTTIEQMKMFLTRLGTGSKMVVTGDLTQVDLPREKICGLAQAQIILADVAGIGCTVLTEKDVARHDLVRTIIKAYEKHDREGGRP